MPPQNPDTTEPADMTEDIRSRMRRGLVAAMKARDQQAVAALRSTLAAIDNAEAIDNDEVVDDDAIDDDAIVDDAIDDEAVDAGSALGAGGGHPAVAGSLLGVGAAEVDRRILTPEEVAEVVRDEVTEREVAAELLERVGHPDRAQHLRAQAEFLAAYLDPPGPYLSS